MRLRTTRPDVERPFAVPGGRWGIVVVCALGGMFSLAAFAVGFVPPAGLPEASVLSHTAVLVGAVVVGTVAPLAISRWSHHRRAV
jgi:hypothetical protein